MIEIHILYMSNWHHSTEGHSTMDVVRSPLHYKASCLLPLIEIQIIYMNNWYNSIGGHSTVAVVRRPPYYQVTMVVANGRNSHPLHEPFIKQIPRKKDVDFYHGWQTWCLDNGGSSYHTRGIMAPAFYYTNCSCKGCEFLSWVTNMMSW